MNQLLFSRSMDLLAHILSFLDSLTLISSLPVSSLFYSAVTHDVVWKPRWIWKTNQQIPLTYSLYRNLRNLEIEYLHSCLTILDNNFHPTKYDQNYETMSLIELECLLVLCHHMKSHYQSPQIWKKEDTQRNEDPISQTREQFFNHLSFSQSNKLFSNESLSRLILHHQATIQYHWTKRSWALFFLHLQNPNLPKFYQHISCVVMEGLVQIAESLQPLGCQYSQINVFVRAVVERTWIRLGEIYQLQELQQPSSPRSSFPSVGWSLPHHFHVKEITTDLDPSFQRKRDIVSYFDRVKTLHVLRDVFIHDFHYHGAGEFHYYLTENSFIDHVVLNRRGIPLTGCALFQYCAHCVGLSSLAMIGLPGHIILGINTNLDTSTYIYHPNDTLFLDIHHEGQILTVFDAIHSFTSLVSPSDPLENEQQLPPHAPHAPLHAPVPPHAPPQQQQQHHHQQQQQSRILEYLTSSPMSCESTLLRTMNNLIFVHNRQTIPSSYRSIEFLSILLSYLNIQIILLLSNLPSLPSSLSPAPSPGAISSPISRPTRSFHWNITNIAIFQKFLMITKDLQLFSIYHSCMREIQSLHNPPSLLLEINTSTPDGHNEGTGTG